MQAELVGDFLETDIFIFFVTSFSDCEKSASLFLLSLFFPDTLKHKESDGESLRSVASLCLEILKSTWRFMKGQI